MDINLLSEKIAALLLEEEFSDERAKQDDITSTIKARNLQAPVKKDDEKTQTITDEAEEDEDSEKEKDEEEIDPKPAPEPEEDDESESFEAEVKAPPKDPTVDDIADQINNLRAGKSLKDEGVLSQLNDYFEKLGQAEERSLYVFLSSLAAILTGGATGEEAPRPETMGVNIDMKPKKVKQPTASAIPQVDTTGAQAPITVGEVSDTTAYKLMVLEGHGPGDRHRCVDGRLVKFGSRDCIRDVKKRINDTMSLRDGCGTGTADRASLNGVLKFLRQKLRAANKIYADR